MLLELAAVILEPLGYHLKTFRDPDLALQSYISSNPRPDLLITDYAMHEMNGMALMESCLKLRPRQKVLLISGTVDESIYRHAKVRPDRFLAKPYQAKQLIDIVRELLAEARRSKDGH
jgi:DNA-binding NtrC family response regulator